MVDAIGSPQGVEQAASERFRDFIRDDPDWPLLFFEFWAYGARNRRLRGEFVKQRTAEVKIIAEAIERQTAAAGVELPLSPNRWQLGSAPLSTALHLSEF